MLFESPRFVLCWLSDIVYFFSWNDMQTQWDKPAVSILLAFFSLSFLSVVACCVALRLPSRFVPFLMIRARPIRTELRGLRTRLYSPLSTPSPPSALLADGGAKSPPPPKRFGWAGAACHVEVRSLPPPCGPSLNGPGARVRSSCALAQPPAGRRSARLPVRPQIRRGPV